MPIFNQNSGFSARRAGLLAAFLLIIPSAQAHPVVDTILAKYGAEAFKQAKEIRFTFHAKMIGIGPTRTWIWKPQSDSVTRVDKGISYSRKSMNAAQKALDANFVNDQYWLIFPLHLGMDKGMQITVDSALTPSPIRKTPLRRVEVAYTQPAGYTPNDSYELYVDPEGLIKEWVYHKGGKKLGLKWTWEKYETFSGILFAEEHHGLAHIYFTDIEVR